MNKHLDNHPNVTVIINELLALGVVLLIEPHETIEHVKKIQGLYKGKHVCALDVRLSRGLESLRQVLLNQVKYGY